MNRPGVGSTTCFHRDDPSLTRESHRQDERRVPAVQVAVGHPRPGECSRSGESHLALAHPNLRLPDGIHDLPKRVE